MRSRFVLSFRIIDDLPAREDNQSCFELDGDPSDELANLRQRYERRY